VLIAVILERLLRHVTRRLIPAPGRRKAGPIGTDAASNIQKLSQDSFISAGTAVIIVGAILMALPSSGFQHHPHCRRRGLASLAFGFGGATSGSRFD